eukprot:COSAG06_NODE_2972_length_6011_cov_2.740528_7_plen_151_part_00
MCLPAATAFFTAGVQAGRLGVKIDRHVGISQRSIEVCGVAGAASRLLRQRRQLRFVPANEQQLRQQRSAVGKHQATLLNDRDQRAQQVLVRSHPTGYTVHDDAQFPDRTGHCGSSWDAPAARHTAKHVGQPTSLLLVLLWESRRHRARLH